MPWWQGRLGQRHDAKHVGVQEDLEQRQDPINERTQVGDHKRISDVVTGFVYDCHRQFTVTFPDASLISLHKSRSHEFKSRTSRPMFDLNRELVVYNVRFSALAVPGVSSSTHTAGQVGNLSLYSFPSISVLAHTPMIAYSLLGGNQWLIQKNAPNK
jgi:hypothetical protein